MAKLYRVLGYDGDQKAIDATLDHSVIIGERCFGPVIIRAAIIDPDDAVSVSFARNKMRTLVVKIEPKVVD